MQAQSSIGHGHRKKKGVSEWKEEEKKVSFKEVHESGRPDQAQLGIMFNNDKFLNLYADERTIFNIWKKEAHIEDNLI